jgi:hypothetical protein
VERIGVMRNSYSILVGKSEGKRTLGNLGIRVTTILKRMLETGCEGECVDWIHSA